MSFALSSPAPLQKVCISSKSMSSFTATSYRDKLRPRKTTIRDTQVGIQKKHPPRCGVRKEDGGVVPKIAKTQKREREEQEIKRKGPYAKS